MMLIWLVWADRGDYSDRVCYPVCWFDNEADAQACARRMGERSDYWRKRIFPSATPYVEKWREAAKDIGDEQWRPSYATEYSAVPLASGALP